MKTIKIDSAGERDLTPVNASKPLQRRRTSQMERKLSFLSQPTSLCDVGFLRQLVSFSMDGAEYNDIKVKLDYLIFFAENWREK